MKTEIIKTKNLRELLKSMMESEISNLPELMEGLEPQVRINFIIKLMPYVYPKVDNVSPSSGEGYDFGFGLD